MRILPGLTWFVLVVALAACTSKPTEPLRHEAYIWQRQWTAALADSIHAMGGDFSGWRVLAGESAEGGEWTAVSPRLDLLARSAKPVTAVLRLNGSRPPPAADVIAQRIDEIVAAWRGAGVPLAGIEIDHDCATAQLDAYAALLAEIRRHLPGDLRLSITALPTWIGAPALTRVLAGVDASVLQVHAVVAPRAGEAGLFDPMQAERWIDAYAAISSRPFRVALPAYGLRVGFDGGGRAVAVEGEMQRTLDADSARELRADPIQVAALLRRLERTHPAQFAGVVWFRLPSEDDRRAWSTGTLRAVMAGAALKPEFAARALVSSDGAADIALVNRGTLDAAPAGTVTVAAKDCSAADALLGFRAERIGEGWIFFPPSDAILRAGHERRIGWVRCATIERVFVHELP